MSLTKTDNKEYKRQMSDDVEKTVVGFLNTFDGELSSSVLMTMVPFMA
jgi:hypothetical protein